MARREIPKRYYTGYKLLDQKDEKGEIPGIYLSNSNRSAGKTTFFLIDVLDHYFDGGEKFLMVFREKSEIENPETMFEYVQDTYFPESLMTSKSYIKRLVTGIYVDNKLAGYAICLKDAVKLKKYSAIFSGVQTGIFDELQPEDGRYLRNEAELFSSIIKTVSRGNGEQSRYVRWILLSNNITVMNPYFLSMGIYKKMPEHLNVTQGNEVYIKGSGYVCEFSFNETAATQMEENQALRALNTRNEKLGVSADFMLNTSAFIVPKMKGKMDYLFTLKYRDKMYGVRRLQNGGIIYITHTHDPSFKLVLALTAIDHNELTIQLRTNTFQMNVLRDSYTMGRLRFSSVEVKNDIIELLGIDLYR